MNERIIALKTSHFMESILQQARDLLKPQLTGPIIGNLPDLDTSGDFAGLDAEEASEPDMEDALSESQNRYKADR